MRAVIRYQDLKPALEAAGRAVPSKTTLPACANLLIEASHENLRLTGTNLDVAIVTHFHTRVADMGACAVGYRELMGALKGSKRDDMIVLATTDDGKSLVVTTAIGRARLATSPIAEQPPIPQARATEHVADVDGATLRDALRAIAHAISDEDSRPVLSGALMRLDGDTLTIIAADGFQLATERAPLSSLAESGLAVIVPRPTVNELVKTLPDGHISVYYSGYGITGMAPEQAGALTFEGHGYRLVTRTIEGTFPNYEQIIPVHKDGELSITWPITAALAALPPLAAVARAGAGMLRIEPNGDSVTMWARHGTGNEECRAEATLPATISGKGHNMALDIRYLANTLKALGHGYTTMTQHSASQPIVFTGEERPTWLGLVMPMHVNP